MSCTPDDESMEETDACFIVRERQRRGSHTSIARMNRDGERRRYSAFSPKTTAVCGFT